MLLVVRCSTHRGRLDDSEHVAPAAPRPSLPIWDFSCIWVDNATRSRHHPAMAHADVKRLAREVERLGTLALPYADLHREITDRVRQAIPIDAACWHGIDPSNVLLTTADPVELLANGFLSPQTEPIAAGAVVASEYQRDDVKTFAALAGRRRPSAILSEPTRGRPSASTGPS